VMAKVECPEAMISATMDNRLLPPENASGRVGAPDDDSVLGRSRWFHPVWRIRPALWMLAPTVSECARD